MSEKKHGGMAEILRSKQAPGMRLRWPNEGRYVSGVAKYSGDPGGFCSTRHEALEKAKQQGKPIVADCT